MVDQPKQPTAPVDESKLAFVLYKLGIPAEALARAEAGQAASAAPFHFVIGPDATLYPGFPQRPREGEPVRIAVVLAQGAEKRTLDATDRAQLLDTLKAEDRALLTRFIAAAAEPTSTVARGAPPSLHPGGESLGAAAPAAVPPVTTPQTASPVSIDPGPFTGSPEQLGALRPHVVNLNRGALSHGGSMQTTVGDLTKLAQKVAAECVGSEAKTLLFFAHGGLTDERTALASAWTYHKWWLDNGVYPVFFVWETGALETVWQIIGAKLGRTRAVTRDIADHTSDPVVEAIARGPGTAMWSAMKDSAELAAEKSGGATMLADALVKELAGRTLKQVVAVGHSAGSIFHAHFLPMLVAKGIEVKQVHLLAPAITCELYDSRLAPVFAGRSAKPITMYTMSREAERADNCGGVFRKSLLYLVSNAFERGEGRKILGMEDFWEESRGALIDAQFGPSAVTASRSHGGFDNDQATMESVMRRIRGLGPSTPLDHRFPAGGVRVGRDAPTPANFYGIPDDAFAAPVATLPPVIEAATGSALVSAAFSRPLQSGRRRLALCIGNDAFAGDMRLSGCIADARAWAETFQAAGFEAKVLENAGAAQMRDTIRSCAQLCAPGDTLALHISSHGTQVPDLDGDESEDEQFADVLDEAVLGIDWDAGGLVIDDEWPGLLATRPGVHVVRFHDFCHAGRTTRMLVRPGRKVRSVNIGEVAAQRAVAALGKRAERAARGGYGQDAGYLTFCACQPHQLSAEEQGMGLFSRATNALLRGIGAGFSAIQLANEIARSLEGENQQPLIEGPDAMAALPVFGAP